jgi:hypothetical protein
VDGVPPLHDRKSSATTWTVVVATPAGAVTQDHLGPFLRALLANAGAIAPAASFDADTRTLAARFQVFADTRDDAALRGCFAYWGAVAAAGVELDAEPTLEVAPSGDVADGRRFTAHGQVTRA